MRDFLRETRSGQWLLWAMGAALIMVALEMVRIPRIDRPLHAVCALVIVAALALNSHAGAMFGMGPWYELRGGVWPLAAEAVHLIAVGIWGGPLLYLAWSRPRPAERADYLAAVRRFSTAALPTVCVFIASGVFLGCIHLDAVGQLTSSFYGEMLLAKIVAVALLLGVALHNRRALPRIEGTAALRQLRGAMQLETGLLLLVLTITNALASADPPHLHRVRDQAPMSAGVPPWI